MLTPEKIQAVADQRALEAIGYVFSFGLRGWSVYYKGEKIIRVTINTGRKSVTDTTLMKYRLKAIPIAIADKRRRGL